MKHIVFLVRNYYPYSSAVGICIGNVAEDLLKDHKITVVCEKAHFHEMNEEIYKNQKIIRVLSKSTKSRKKLQELLSSDNTIKKRTAKILDISYRSFEYIKFLMSKSSLQNDLVENYKNALKNINEPIDIIVPACMPFEAIVAAAEFSKKRKNTEVVPFLFDKYAENATLHKTKWNKKLKFKNNLQLEKKVFEISNRILFTPSWSNHLNKNFYYLNDKFKPVEHPLLKKIKDSNLVTYDRNRINIVYTGTVVLNNRNPEPTINILRSIIPEFPEMLIHFYAMGNAVGSLKDFEVTHKNNVIYHGQVTTEVAHSAIVNSTVLLSIGNTDITQTPSKIFEYMSSGKPIVHIAVSENDPVLSILKSYPKACLVSLENDSFEEQIEKVKIFLSQKYLNEISFLDLEKVFYNARPKYSAKQILNEH